MLYKWCPDARTLRVDLLSSRDREQINLLLVGDKSKLVTIPLGQLGIVILTVKLCHATQLCHNYLSESSRSQPWIVVASYSNDDTSVTLLTTV